MAMKKAPAPDFPATFAALKSIFEPYAVAPLLMLNTREVKLPLMVGRSSPRPAIVVLPVVSVTASSPSVSTIVRGKPLWGGGVNINKTYVSFHFMPVYAFPDLVNHLSPELKKRMQGKSCFNLTFPDPHVIAELEKLVKAGFHAVRTRKILGAE